MHKITITARILLGLIFTVFGLNGFLQFMPMPPMPDAAGAFLGAMAQTGYLFPLLKSLEVLTGLALLANRFVPLALVILAPIAANILAFHTFLTPPNPVAYLIVLAGGWLAWAHRDAYAPLFRPTAVARTAAPSKGSSPSPRADSRARRADEAASLS